MLSFKKALFGGFDIFFFLYVNIPLPGRLFDGFYCKNIVFAGVVGFYNHFTCQTIYPAFYILYFTFYPDPDSYRDYRDYILPLSIHNIG